MNTITGKEVIADSNDPLATVVRFYAAFNTQELGPIGEIWLKSEDVRMYNPIGGISVGWKEIVQVYNTIFQSGMNVYVQLTDIVTRGDDKHYSIIGKEHGQFMLSGSNMVLEIRTSRHFEKIDGKWQQVHHHGSIADPKMLENYQIAIKRQLTGDIN